MHVCPVKPQKTYAKNKKMKSIRPGMVLFSLSGGSRWREKLTVGGSRVEFLFFYKERLTETVRKIEVQR